MSVLQIASRIFQESGRAIGPATTLAVMLGRNGWCLSGDGRCTGPGCAEFSVRFSSRKQVTRAILSAWSTELGTMLQHRNGLSNLGAVDARSTQNALAKQPRPFQGVAINCISGGHMSCAARSQWDRLTSNTCRFYGSKDTKWHRCFECPVAGQLRRHFESTLEWVKCHAPHWIHAAVALQHPDSHVLRLIFARRVHVPPPSPVSAPSQQSWTFYTDGSCSVPRFPQARHASWAVIFDAAPSVPTAALLAAHQSAGKAPPVCMSFLRDYVRANRALAVARSVPCSRSAKLPCDTLLSDVRSGPIARMRSPL